MHADAAGSHGGGASYMLKSGAPTGVRCEGGHIHVAKAPCGAAPLYARAASIRWTCAVTAICLVRVGVRGRGSVRVKVRLDKRRDRCLPERVKGEGGRSSTSTFAGGWVGWGGVGGGGERANAAPPAWASGLWKIPPSGRGGGGEGEVAAKAGRHRPRVWGRRPPPSGRPPSGGEEGEASSQGRPQVKVVARLAGCGRMKLAASGATRVTPCCFAVSLRRSCSALSCASSW